MAYDKVKILEKTFKVIEKHKLFFIEDVVAYLPCTKTTFYEFFPIDSDEMNTIKGMIEENKVKIKVTIRSKLLKGKGSELIALYKLVGTDEERIRLSTQNVDHTSKGNEIAPNIINLGVGINPDEDKD